eukprot:GFYU01000124.1.p1 GENE.GFYU01000124.1~~GFYU01000124.1.p1  ORF type:complete len:505 (+),score=211.57 GFYU01000124.1:89-1603(+)
MVTTRSSPGTLAGIPYTSIKEIPGIVKAAKAAFRSGKTKSYEWRMSQLKAIQTLVRENMDDLVMALRKDLGHKTGMFEKGVEIDTITQEVKHMVASLSGWMKPEKKTTPLLMFPASSYVKYEPYGTTLIISPWNYPLSLALVPIASAISAGNTVVFKPSEVSEHSNALLSKLIAKYLDNDCIKVVNGAVAETQAVLEERFDLIMYTGNTAVGKIIMEKAAKNLTPVLLELGGKSPAIICDDANLSTIVPRLVWAKYFMNMGQTCISPDYIMVTKNTEKKLVEELKKCLKNFFTENPRSAPDVSRIINQRHTQRLAGLLDDKSIEIIHGGDYNIEDQYMEPTIVRATLDSKCMQDEIFGPILPIVLVKNEDEAIDIVNDGEKPLALYAFTESSATKDKILDGTSSGGACINECILHAGNPHLPFGGVGHSGIGAYHGKYCFTSFSHQRAVLEKGTGMADPPLRFPPYTDSKISQFMFLRGLNESALYTVLGAAGAGLAGLVYNML